MKLSIEQVKIYEAFENQSVECPLCIIESEYERQLIEVILGEMVMDSEFYTKIGNEFSFCRWHFEKLNKAYDKLGLALILDKIIDVELKKIDKDAPSLSKNSFISTIFKPNSKIKRDNKNEECFICNKIHAHIIDNIGILLNLWIQEKDFRDLYKNCKGFCKKHYLLMLSHCNNHVYDKEVNEFIEVTKEIQKKHLKELQEDIQWFIKKFDYLNADAPWGTSKGAVQRALKKIVGYSED